MLSMMTLSAGAPLLFNTTYRYVTEVVAMDLTVLTSDVSARAKHRSLEYYLSQQSFKAGLN